MASPQTENGYTAISNEILEAIAKCKLNGTQFRIVMIVWRSTYGWNKKEYEISGGFIAKATGINKTQVNRELNLLIKKGIITEIRASTYNTSRIISFNKDYDKWCQSISTLSTNKLTVNESVDRGINELVDRGINELVDQKNYIKNNIKNNNSSCDYKDIFDYYLTLNLIKHKSYTYSMSEAIKRAINQNKYTIDDCKLLLDRHKKIVEITKATKFKVQVRGLDVFFGQKVQNGTHLICSEYEEGGSKYERHLKIKEIVKAEPKTVEVKVYDSYDDMLKDTAK